MAADASPLSRPRALAYGALGLPLAFGALPIYVFVPSFYANAVGLPLALVGGILLAARLCDAVLDPWLGWLADRLPRRRMMAAALPPFAVGFVALFNPPAGDAAPWLLGSLALTYLGFSAATVAYQAWGADLAPSPAGRTRLTAAREGFGLGGVVLAAILPSVLATGPDEGLVRLGWLLPPVLLVAALVTLTGAGGSDGPPVNAMPLRASFARVARDEAFRRLLAVFVANGVAAALPATLFPFFAADVLHAGPMNGWLLALYFVAGAASLPLWVTLARRWGRVCAWLAAMGLAVLAFGGAAALGPGDVLAFGLICMASGLALGADLALPAAIAADIGERARLAGACFGVWNFVAKLNLALAAGLALPLIGWLGYVPGGEAPGGEGVAPLVFAYAILPLGFKLLAAGLLWRWRHCLEIR